MKTKQLFLIAAMVISCSFVCTYYAEAKVWRVNNNPGVNADFTQVSVAVSSASVVNGDTLYIEGSATAYNNATLTKKLVLIGAGYLLDATGNPGLQAFPQPSVLAFTVDSLASGSVFQGLSGNYSLNPRVDDLTFTRCNMSIGNSTPIPANSVISNMVINKCRVSINLSARMENLLFTNNIVISSSFIANMTSGLIRNNVITVSLNTSNAYVSNNIFTNTNTNTFVNSTVRYNISAGNNLPAGNNNQVNIPAADIFAGGASPDGQYQLKPGSPALAAGEPINGITPDAGAFGTADPYRLSGIPPVPTIYSLSAPASIPSSATTMNIIFSTRSNN